MHTTYQESSEAVPYNHLQLSTPGPTMHPASPALHHRECALCSRARGFQLQPSANKRKTIVECRGARCRSGLELQRCGGDPLRTVQAAGGTHWELVTAGRTEGVHSEKR